MAGKFEPKTPVNLAPPKDDPIAPEDLAAANGEYSICNGRQPDSASSHHRLAQIVSRTFSQEPGGNAMSQSRYIMDPTSSAPPTDGPILGFNEFLPPPAGQGLRRDGQQGLPRRRLLSRYLLSPSLKRRTSLFVLTETRVQSLRARMPPAPWARLLPRPRTSAQSGTTSMTRKSPLSTTGSLTSPRGITSWAMCREPKTWTERAGRASQQGKIIRGEAKQGYNCNGIARTHEYLVAEIHPARR